jgi:broad specificity phosphatase PhoE
MESETDIQHTGVLVSGRVQRITLIRHAPTAANTNGVFMGHRDAPSTKAGLAAARKLGISLRLPEDVRLFTSPLLRSRTTLDVLCPQRKQVVDWRIRERGLGDWEGRSKVAVRRLFPQAFTASGTIDPRFTPPQGERIDSFALRVCEFLVEVANAPRQSSVFVVTHNGVIAVMRSLLEVIPLPQSFAQVEPFLTPRTYEYSAGELFARLELLLDQLY